MTHTNNKGGPCCPKFDTVPWDNKSLEWRDKLFIKDTIPQLFHMPLPSMVKKTVTKMWNDAKNEGAEPDLKDFLLLAADPSPWKSEFYMNVTKEVSSAENVKLSGTFLTKVFDGPYNAVPKWIKEMDKYVAGKNKIVKKFYIYFTTCPKCAKIYGHNYAVAFAEVE